jgi:hypothetical protein
MNWINIYNDISLITKYGGEKAIPRVYLINPKGQIVYSREDDNNDLALNNLQSLLDKSIH